MRDESDATLVSVSICRAHVYTVSLQTVLVCPVRAAAALRELRDNTFATREGQRLMSTPMCVHG